MREWIIKKFEVHVAVEHWMYVTAENAEEAQEIAEEAVYDNADALSNTDYISDDDIER